jgi:membrane protein
MPTQQLPLALDRDWKRAPVEIVRAFSTHECFFLAAGISFYFMLSLIPMLFLLLAVIGYFLRGSESVHGDLLDAVRAYIPFLSDEIIRNIEQVVRKPHLLGWIGGGALFLSTDLVFVAMQSSLDKIFVPGRRGFLKSKMFSVLAAVVVFLVVLGTIAVNAVDGTVARLEEEALRAVAGAGGELPVGLHLSRWMIVALLLACFTLAIRTLPHPHVPVRYAFWGAALATGLWALGRAYYLWYLENVSKVGPLFGSLSAVVMTMIWVYVSSLMFLLGAELTRWLIVTDPRRAGRRRSAAGTEQDPVPEGD